MDRRLNQACQPCVTPLSRSSLDHHLNVARTAEDGSVQKSSVNKSAKVVLVPIINIMVEKLPSTTLRAWALRKLPAAKEATS